MELINNAIKELEKYNQNKVINIMQKLDKEKQENLAIQILNTNIGEIIDLYNRTKENSIKENNIQPIDYLDKNKLSREDILRFSQIGEKIIKDNQYAVVTMAGGQGTRLGWKGPKGTFKLNIGENGKYIFEIFVDTLKRAKEQYGVEVYWYIMTSLENELDTIEFFEKNNYFGYNKEKVKFFTQSVLPLVDMEGNLLIDKNFNLKKASDGNGSIYKSLKNTGMIDDMNKKGIKWIYVSGVDNILSNLVDSLFLGLTISKDAECASKSTKKLYPEEKVGVFCKKNGKPRIVEYIDLDENKRNATNENGELLYGESNIVCHLYNIECLEKIANYKLQYHAAIKKNSYINENLEEYIPDKPNSYKFESFIFDGFEYVNNMQILRVNREDEFAPIKNKEGNDSPETAKKLYEAKFLRKDS